MNKICIILIILLVHVSLCFGEDIDKEKFELSPQSEEGTNTPDSIVYPEMTANGTVSSVIEEPPPVQPIPESATTGTTSDSLAGIINETESSIVGSSAPSSQLSESVVAGTITSTTTGTSGSTTATQTDAPPTGIWSKISPWIIALSGTPTITGSPSTTGLMIVPTAYRLDKQRKLNIDFMFTYYIGEFWNKTKYKESEKIDIFNPINQLRCSGDFKYSLILEKKWIPAVALGCQRFIVLQGKASSAKEMGGAVSETSDSFGYTYGILSKRFKNIGVHIGSQSGPIGKLINPILSNKLNIASNSALIAGLNTTICKRTAFVEIIYPKGNECIMINTFIDRFLPFSFTYIRFNNKLSNNDMTGYSIAGYFGIRMPGFPGEKKEKKK
ncbi:MAG: hypothetical protein ABH870_05270 [bacterium]